MVSRDRPALGLAWNNVDLDTALGSFTLLSFERPPSSVSRAQGAAFSWALPIQRSAHAHLENSIAAVKRVLFESREQGHTVDALAPRADEGRGRLR